MKHARRPGFQAAILALALAFSPGRADARQAARGHADAADFWVTEAGYAYSTTDLCSDHYPSFEVGKLYNVGDPFAVGGTFVVGHNEDVVYGLRPRLRAWLSADFAFDAGAGPLWGGSRVRPAGFAAVNYRDLLSLVIQYERYRDGGCGQPIENQVFLGIKVGSRPGVITGVVGTAIAGIIILIVVSQIEN